MRHIDRIVMHHSATSQGSAEQFRAEHKLEGWSDIGYHAVICNGNGGKNGELQAGRAVETKGSAVWGNNTGALHVCCVGNFHKPDKGFTGRPTRAQMNSLGSILISWARRFGKLTLTDHRMDALPSHPTACPGSEYPTALIKQWYELATGRGHMGSLDQFLDSHGYWPAVIVSPPSPSNKLIAVKAVDVKLIDEDGTELACPAFQFDGRTFVHLRTLADQVGWDKPLMITEHDNAAKVYIRQKVRRK